MYFSLSIVFLLAIFKKRRFAGQKFAFNFCDMTQEADGFT